MAAIIFVKKLLSIRLPKNTPALQVSLHRKTHSLYTTRPRGVWYMQGGKCLIWTVMEILPSNICTTRSLITFDSKLNLWKNLTHYLQLSLSTRRTVIMSCLQLYKKFARSMHHEANQHSSRVFSTCAFSLLPQFNFNKTQCLANFLWRNILQVISWLHLTCINSIRGSCQKKRMDADHHSNPCFSTRHFSSCHSSPILLRDACVFRLLMWDKLYALLLYAL